MAKAKTTTKETTAAGEPTSENTALAHRQTTALAAAADFGDFAADAGIGLENADADSFAIPFLSVIQKGSPQVDETHPKAALVDGAKAGMFWNNVSQKFFDGKTGVRFVQAAFRRVFIRWGSEASGEGFKGELSVETVKQMIDRREAQPIGNRLYVTLPDGTVDEERSDRLSDTRNHFILVDDGTGNWTQALCSLSSTQIKQSKQLIAALADVRFTTSEGKKFMPPTFANVVRATTVPESNDEGSWYGVRFKVEDDLRNVLDGAEVYKAAKAFHQQIVAGEVTVKYEGPRGEDAAPAGF